MARKTKMNSITSPELLAQVNKDNITLMNDFLDYLRSIDRGESTINAYKNDLEIAFVWCLQNNNNKSFIDWTKRNVISYQNWLMNENGNSPSRIRRLKASLSSLSNYIQNVLDDEYPNFKNIINKIESPVNQPVREKTVLTNSDIECLLSKLVDSKKYELACFTALAAYGGRRKAELCQFKVNDFEDDKLVCGGSLWKSAPMRTKGRGRKGKIIPCYTLVSKFKPYLELWLEERKRREIDSEWLFPAIDGDGPIKITTVNSWMRTLSNISGLDIYAHSFRHYFTTMLSNEGIPDSVIKEIQHWDSLEMVSIYCDRSTEETLDMYFGSEGIIKREQKGLSEL